MLPPNTQVPLGAGRAEGGTAIAELEHLVSKRWEMQLKLENTGGEPALGLAPSRSSDDVIRIQRLSLFLRTFPSQPASFSGRISHGHNKGASSPSRAS